MADFVDLLRTTLDVALAVYAQQHATTPARILDTLAAPPPEGTRDITLRDLPVMTLSVAPPGSIRILTRGTLPLFPHLSGFVRLDGYLTHTGDNIDAIRLTSFSADAQLLIEKTVEAHLGGHADLTATGDVVDMIFNGMARIVSCGFELDVTFGWSQFGYLLQGDLCFPSQYRTSTDSLARLPGLLGQQPTSRGSTFYDILTLPIPLTSPMTAGAQLVDIASTARGQATTQPLRLPAGLN